MSPDLLLSIESWDAVQLGVHVAGGDAVDTDVVLGPLSSQTLAELDDTSLGSIVAGLLLREVDDAAGHGGNEDDGAGLASGDHGLANSLGHEEGTSQVDIDQTTEHVGVVVLSGDVGISDTGGVDQDVRSAIFLNDGVDGLDDRISITDIDLEEGDWETSESVELSSRLVTEILVGIEDDDALGASFSAGTGHVVTETASTTRRGQMLAHYFRKLNRIASEGETLAVSHLTSCRK